MKVTHLQVNHMNRPFVDEDIEFSWRLESKEQNVMQSAYRISVVSENHTVWDSGKVNGAKQSFIPYEGELQPKTEYIWRVTVWDNKGNEAAAESTFETAFLRGEKWNAKWMESPFERLPVPYYTYGVENPVLRFSENIALCNAVRKARLYATCYGVYRPLVNGKRIDDREFAPEFTPYAKRLEYQCYDVTALLQKGNNRLEMLVGDGWYFCAQTEVATANKRAVPSVLFALDVECENGEKQTYSSDESMLCRKTNILFSDLFMGEKQDLTLAEEEDKPAVVKDYGFDILRCQAMPPIRPAELLEAKSITVSLKGETIVDFGQVIAGRVRVYIDEPKGTKITLEHTEVLDKDGNYFATTIMRQCDTLISDGKPLVFEPMFTFHGFRYLRVSGITNPELSRFTAVLLTTEKENASSFRCSDARFNRLYQNIRYSQKNNMMSIPTDCPTREKAGWTGDIALYAKAAVLIEDMTPFLTNWMEGLLCDQLQDGVIPLISPYTKMYDMVARKTMSDFTENRRTDGLDGIVNQNFLNCGENSATGIAGWSDAVVWVPYAMYKASGNTEIVKRSYSAMKKWCDWIIRTANERKGTDLPDEIDCYLWNTGFHFGEWLVPGRTSEGFEICKESALYIASYFGYKTLAMMSELASEVDKKDAEYYGGIAAKMKEAIVKGLFAHDLLPHYLQGAYVLAFAFDLVPEEYYEEYKKRLVDLVEEHGRCLQTGFLATPYILDALEKIGRKDLAKAVLWQTKKPSWLYEVEHGATSIWESWTAMDEEGNPERISFDHYAFGVIDEWICRKICGLTPDENGYARFTVNPDTDYGFDWVERTFVCEAGEIYIKWDSDALTVHVPPNTQANVIWKGKEYHIGSGEYTF